MGTKVHCKSYLPGYYSMRNINDGANSSWPRYYEDRTLNVQFCNGFAQPPLNGYLDYDKEVLKQTMLRHEEIFRKQVLELHRLYRRQRDLMEEFGRNKEKTFLTEVKSSQPSPFSTQMLPKGMEKSWQVHGFSSTGASCSRTPISDVDDSKNHVNLLNGSSFPAVLMLRENGTSQDNQLLDSRVTKLPRKMLDLELPADTYIDNEDADHAEVKNVIKPLFPDRSKRNYSLQAENDVKLTLGTAQNPCSRDENQKSSSDLQNGLQTCNLADLNEPLKDVSCEEMATSNKFSVQMTYFQGPKGQQKSVESISSFSGLQEDPSQDRYNDGDGSASVHIERYEKGVKLPFFNNEIGQSGSHVNSFTSSISSKNGKPLSEPAPLDPSRAQDFSSMFPPWQDQSESWIREKQHHGSEPSDRSYHTANRVHSGLTVPMTPGSLCFPPFIDYARTASPVVSPWKKPTNNKSHMSTAVQAFPCFGVSTPMNFQSTSLHNLESACERWQCNRGFRSSPNFGSEMHLYPNGFSHGIQYGSATASSVDVSPISSSKPNLSNGANSSYEQSEGHRHQMSLNGLHCMDVQMAKGVNLNLAPLNGFQNGYAPRPKMLSDIEGKKEDLPEEIPWLRTKSPCSEPLRTDKAVPQKELASVQGHSQLMPSYCCLSGREVEQKTETEVSSSVKIMQDLPSVLKPEGTTMKQNETIAASGNSRIIGFSLPQRTHQSNISFTIVAHQKICPDDDDEVKNRAKRDLFPDDSSHHRKPLDLENPVHVEVAPQKGTSEVVNCFRSHINLNSSATSVDELKSSQSSSEDEIKLPSPPSVRGIATRFAPEIDLEAPPPSLEEEQALLSEPAPHIEQLVQPVEPEGRKEDQQITQYLDEALARIAAEAIQIISLDRAIHSEDAACHALRTASVDTLHWFADWVTSNGDNPEGIEALKCEGDINMESSEIDGMDYFEYMTLNLAETRIDDYCFGPMEAEHSEEEETGVAHLLLTKPRRGQARRRRQRRDFQRDILPGLASLSRQEVTEDLQIIGGLMKASGQPRKAGGTRRNGGRNRPRRQARGSRGPRATPSTAAAAATVAQVPGVPQPRQSSKEEAAVERRSILGWGRTTKRCRRQRCPPGGVLLSPPS